MFVLSTSPPYTIRRALDSTFKLSYTIPEIPVPFKLHHPLYIGTFPTFKSAIARIKELLEQEGDSKYNWYKECGFKGTREEFDQFCCFELSDEKFMELCFYEKPERKSIAVERYAWLRDFHTNPDKPIPERDRKRMEEHRKKLEEHLRELFKNDPNRVEEILREYDKRSPY